ncbi:MAG: Stage V sporulation protein E [Microgenomates bacterium 39_7]|nr:MAG: Stage V sporulation protein E [Microgenomates bacterium 39_7]
MNRNKKISLSTRLLILLLILCGLGIFFVLEASAVESYSLYGHQYYYVLRQLQWFGVGVFAFIIGWLTPNKIWKKFSPILYVVGLILMSLVFIPSLGIEINGARRWFVLFGISIQPVEFFKIGLILFFSKWLLEHQRILPLFSLLVLPSAILLLQPDFGSLLVVLFTAFCLYYAGGGSLKKLSPFVLGFVLVLTLAVIFSPYRIRRVQTFFNPESDPLGASFQIRQITLALGSGGMWGRGLGNSQQKYAFIPEASSDSIFAIVAEEVGFIGSMVIISLFLYYLYTLFQLSQSLSNDSYSQLLTTGLFILVAGQTLLNLGAIVALVPLTGLPLPFFSYGGSALVSLLFLNGVGYKIAKEAQL